jgi:dihydroflavonol-4-reductase
MTTLVTGATGHVGTALVQALLQEKRRVRVFVRDHGHLLDGLAVERVEGDIRAPEDVRRAVEGAQVVYHLAAHISIVRGEERLIEACNVAGVKNVVRACLDAGVRRLVHFSSIHAFSGRPVDGLVDERRPLVNPWDIVPAYDRSKALGEREVQAGVLRGLDAVIVNPTAVLGPPDHRPSAMGQVLLDIYRRRLVGLVGGGFNFVDVRDVVAGAMAAEARGRRGHRYLLSGHWMSVQKLAGIVQAVTGVKAPWFVCPMWLARATAPFAEAYADVAKKPARFTSSALHALRNHRQISSQKAQEELGYRARPTRETVADTFDWFREAKVI